MIKITTITIRKKIEPPACPTCGCKDMLDVSNIEYPYMYQCQNPECGKITQVKFDLQPLCMYCNVVLSKDNVYMYSIRKDTVDKCDTCTDKLVSGQDMYP